MTPLTTGFSFPAHGSDAFLHGGCVRPGGGDEREKTPPPGRNFPTCTKRSLPWQGKEIVPPVNGG